LREGAEVREAGLGLALTHLRLARLARGALAARAHEGDGDALVCCPAGDLAADLVDHARELVAGDVRQRDVAVVPLPRVPVGTAHARGLDPDDCAVRPALRLGDLFDPERPAEGVDDDGAHQEPGRSRTLMARRSSIAL